ncbi:class A beta-lactamase [Arthrobacter castelli]|uniref:class A beta-lactamase n=1 Tax=Arthrobacter castelli TaxID=271431 RepID=UPI0004254878|nr:class A beta-lactamase [Arthrobacter castelli]
MKASFAELEEQYQGRVGVYAVDTETGHEVQYRADERFAYASTHKVFSVAAVLAQSEPADLDEVVHYSSEDLVEYSPVTEKHVDSGMTVRSIMRAAIINSDNTAGNLLFDMLGGPEGLQAYLAKLGDRTTSVDRIEPELNKWKPGQRRDTTTPRQAVTNLAALTHGNALEPWAQKVLLEAMRDAENSDGLIRAAVPDAASTTVGNKSGAGIGYGTRNDIAVIEREGQAPVFVAVYTNLEDSDGVFDDAFVADAARAALSALD